jgi:hypothetical protein
MIGEIREIEINKIRPNYRYSFPFVIGNGEQEVIP